MKGQLSINTIVMVIVAVVVLSLILIFVTSQFRQGSEQLDTLSPGDQDVAITACQFACDQANLIAKSEDDCDKWKNKYCSKTVNVDGQTIQCSDSADSIGFVCSSDYGCGC